MEWDYSKTIKAGDLKRQLANVPDNTDISFGPGEGERLGSLCLYRLKWRGDNLLNFEFNEIFEVTYDPSESD